MNKHLKCLLIFVAIIVTGLLISIGFHLLLDWLAYLFSRKAVTIGLEVIMLGAVVFLTHLFCNVEP